VVEALQRFAIAAAIGHQLRTAMAADVDEGAQARGFIAQDDDGHVVDARGEEIAGPGNLLDQPDVLPGAAKDAFLLALQDFRVGIPRAREGIARFERGMQVRTVGSEGPCAAHISSLQRGRMFLVWYPLLAVSCKLDLSAIKIAAKGVPPENPPGGLGNCVAAGP